MAEDVVGMTRAERKDALRTHDTEGIPLVAGQRLPDFRLLSDAGRSVRLSDFRGCRNLVVAFCNAADGAASRSLLTGLAARYAEFVQDNAEILAVIHGSVESAERIRRSANLPFPVLADEDGRVHRVVGAAMATRTREPAVYVADRYGEIFYAHRTAVGQPPPATAELLGWVGFIELQCPE
jgi:peroxiredoxin Q/BCP